MIFNFVNFDMVGYIGNIEVIKKVVEVIVECVGKVIDFIINEFGGVVIILVDYGNVE